MEHDDSYDSVENPMVKMDHNGGIISEYHHPTDEPYVEIVEQPQARGFRFRYECEGPSHGGLQGEKSEKYRKTFPSIRIRNYSGSARIVVSLVTNEAIPKPHAHKLVGKNCSNGSCIVELKPNQNTVTFPNLCIQHVTRRKASEVIEYRILESMKLDKQVKLGNLNAQTDLSDDEKSQASSQASQLAKDMQLNVVKLCFQAYLRDESGKNFHLLPPVLSTAIYDSKAPGANALKICRMDKYGGCCTGNEEVFLLCERVQKDDIQVRFVEQDDDGKTIWEAFGNFGPFDVHRQYAIVFKTPAYKNPNIDRPVSVIIMLQRKSDTETSEPKSFTYYPQSFDKDEIAKKRKKTLPSYPGSNGFGGGTGGEDGRTNLNSSFHNGALPFGPPQGNIPVMVNDSEQSLSNDSLHNPSPKISNATKRRINKAKRQGLKPVDIEVDGGRIQGLPTIITEPSHLQVAGPPDIHVTQPNFQQHPNINLQHFAQLTAQSFPHQMFVPRGGGGRPTSVVDASNDSSSSGMDEVDATVYDGRKDIHLDRDDSVVLRKDIMLTQDTSPDSGRETPDDIESDAPVAVHSVEKSDISELKSSDISVKTANLKLDSVAASEEDVLVEPVEPDTVGKSAMAASETCDQSVQTDKDEVVRTTERTVKALQTYASTGDIRQLLLVQRYLTSVPDQNGDIPLHTAIINGNKEVVNNLLDVMQTMSNLWLKINAYNNLLQTPLHLAVLTGQEEIIDRLLCAGANTKLPDRNGNTPAHLAVQTGNTSCLAKLLKYQRPFSTPQNPFPELNMKNFDGFTPAHIAAQKGNLQAIKLLVRCKADINMADGKSGKTPLHYAVEEDDLSVSSYLILEAGASVDSVCFNGNTALHIACGRQNSGMVALLMAAGASPEIENSEALKTEISSEDEEEDVEKALPGHKPRHYAVGNTRILKILNGEPYGGDSVSSIKSLSGRTDFYLEANSLLASEDFQTDTVPPSPPLTSPPSSLTCPPAISVVLSSSEDGDIDRISYPVRVQLSKLLDPLQSGSDWVALAERLGLRQSVEGHQGGFSPTRLLLTFYESCGGTVSKLLEALVAMERYDAVELINSALSVQTDDWKRRAMQRSVTGGRGEGHLQVTH
ncbi:nuclear factor NF-kappa-B p105 subunit-like [Saccostrea cucullata]|uniref:nuclear factor NF-kappa-B p105 subunit-like n=1 Tax=Saccostrea cuccullata TaxID=36930 RepID=UPI002ED049A8